MNKLLITITLFILSYSINATVKDDFKQANSLYKNSEYKEAKGIYLQLLKDGHFSSELYYNLGNVYYKLNDIAPAILYYEKANKLTPLNEDIRHNLAFAYKLTVDKKDNLDDELLSAWWGTVVKYQPLNRWAVYSVLLFLFSAFLLVIYLFAKKKTQKQIAFYCALISFTGFIFVLFVGFQSKHLLNTTTHGIIFSPSVTVLSEPKENSTSLFTLHEGAKVELLSEESKWQRIQFADDKIGWIKKNNVKGI
jgi:tetratricopeptide (TPR) repeat protein